MSVFSSNALKVFHGSKVEVINPEIRVGKYTKDFGVGFYVTKFKSQAEKWASKKSDGIVSVYDFIPNDNLNILKFDSMTEEWLDFLIHCRTGNSHNYDIVEGPMADDTIYDAVVDLLEGTINRVIFWELVKFKYPTHQIVLCTSEALDTIKFKYSYEVKFNAKTKTLR